MPSTSRRRALQLSVGAFVSVAGCSAETERDGPPPREESVYITDAESSAVRGSGPDPILDDPDSEESEFFELLVSESRATALEFVREPDGTAAVRSFVEETRFDAESLFVVQTRIDECHEMELAYLERRPDDELPRPQFCRRTRPADVECSVDAVDTMVVFVRIPEALDDQPTSYGHGSGSSCDLPPHATTDDGGETQ